MAKEYKVGLYVRLSNEDSRAGESVSVENQKLMLTKHARDMGWELKEIYVDDGWSGTNQKRPAFQRMMADVKQGFINTILIKDLSRLGRNYLEVGNLSEVFLPEHGCELISLNEKLDEMAVFRNWFNEQHSKSTSSKVKSVRKMCAENGKFLGAYAPYGYKKDENNRHKLLVDEITAPVIRMMFELRAGGMSYRAIAVKLNEDGVIPPREYFYDTQNKNNPIKTLHIWRNNGVQRIIESEVYIGHLVQGKVDTTSYKNRAVINKPEDEWIRVENCHEPLVPSELWDRVQALSLKKINPRITKEGKQHLFSGTLVCADCGCKLRANTSKKTRKNGNLWETTTYCCGTYTRGGKNICTYHGIGEKVLTDIVTEEIRNKALLVEVKEESIIAEILAMQNSENTSYKKAYQSELDSHVKQIAKLELLIENLYNDRVSGVVPEDMFKRFVAKYENERVERLESIKTLSKRIQAIKDNTDNALTWAKLIKQHTQIETLERETLLLLIDKIVVGESRKVGKDYVRSVKITYNYVGDIDNIALELIQGEAVLLDERQAV